MRESSVLEALAVDNGRARLIILTFRDPHLLEGAERRQNGTTNPHTVLSLRLEKAVQVAKIQHGQWDSGSYTNRAFSIQVSLCPSPMTQKSSHRQEVASS